MKKGASVTLADGEPPLVKLPPEKRSPKRIAHDVVMTGLGVLGSIGPVRRVAKRLYHAGLTAVWRRHRRKQDKRYGD